MFKCWFISTFFLFAAQRSFAQQNNIWYFGKKAGISFSQPLAVVLSNSEMETNEGSASICDNAGNLLFYTNGVTVYNRNHQVMLNGTGLLGNISSVQSGIIIPIPGSNNLFYIFTTDAVENNFADGYNYSIVDMTKDNGNGEVVSKNILLSSSCTERITAVRHTDGNSVWLITNDRNSNIFKAWLISCGGIQPVPVISTIGNVLNTYDLMSTGMMKISSDGKQLCQTHFPDDGGANSNFIQLFDFNNTTGSLSNARKVDFANAKIIACEYSPDSKLLYLLRPSEKKIDQLEARLSTPSDIVSSRITISTGNAEFYGIQLAPDKKIYLSAPFSFFLGAINNPNIKGTGCSFQKEQINISGTKGAIAYAGLPSFINDLSFDGINGFNSSIVDTCTGTVQFNAFSSIPGVVTWDWDFGDGFNSSSQNPMHTFSSTAQSYSIILKIKSTTGCSAFERSILKTIVPKGLLLNTDFDFTTTCNSGITVFSNKSSFSPDTALIKYSWNFDDGNTSTTTNPIHTFTSAGIFDVKLTIKTTNSCLDQSISHTVNLEAFTIEVPAGREIDPGETVQLSLAGGGSRFVWTPGTGLSNPTIANPVAKPLRSTMYVVSAFNDAGCKDTDSIYIKVRQAPGVYVPTGFTPNNDGRNDILKPILADEFVLVEFSIFNRWGQKIFTTSQVEKGWNGNVAGIVQDAGVYIWIVNTIDTRTGKKQESKGTFVILR